MIIQSNILIVSSPVIVRKGLIDVDIASVVIVYFVVVITSSNVFLCFAFLRDNNLIFINTGELRCYFVIIIPLNLGKILSYQGLR